MSYSHASSSVTATNPVRRSAGLIFVVALHILAIGAIKSGLIVPMDNPSVPPIHFIPTFDKPKPPPIPVEVTRPKDPTNFRFTIAVPSDPVFETSKRDESAIDTIEARNSNADDNTEAKAIVLMARVDPTHPLAEPTYPTASRRANEEGRVELMLYILADGTVGEARIAQSSGHSRLDDSAMREAMRSWRFIPQQVDGVAAPSWQRFAITFRLKN